MRVSAIIAAAGIGVRFGAGQPKQLVPLGEKPILNWSLEALSRATMVRELVIVAPSVAMEATADLAAGFEGILPVRVVPGGPTRQDSVRIGLAAVDADLEWVAVHDAARPLVTVAEIESVCLMAQEIGAAILATPVVDTVKEADDSGLVVRTLDRTRLHLAQTPQVCRKKDLLAAYDLAATKGIRAGDEAGLLEALGIPVGIITGNRRNIKITLEDDLELARALLDMNHYE